MRTLAASLALALLYPAAARGQNSFEGLDLSDDPKTEEPAKADSPPPPPKAAPAEADKKPLMKADDGLVGERDTTQEDRVKSVQRKLYLKKGRVELAPYVFTSLNDPYYSKSGVALRAAYYLADTLALSARFSLMQVVPTDDVRTAKRTFQSRIFFSVPIWTAMVDAEWSPIYGKVAFMNSILHFDAYLLGGAGLVTTETSSAPPPGASATDGARGPAIGADLGFGARFVAKDFLAVNLALINTSYVDQPTGTTKGSTQNVMTLNLGLSIFFPFKSTFREAE
ncbi:MAG: outer membrane beta-barrel domain-containing protein [Myxococcaceae bacterium]